MDFRKFDAETENDYIIRICNTYRPYLSWQEIADGINAELGTEYTTNKFEVQHRKYRKKVEQSEKVSQKSKNLTQCSDILNQAAAYMRRVNREETIKEIAHTFAEKMSSKKLLPIYDDIIQCGEKKGILCVSDWHYGIVIDNYWNKFDTDICKSRVAELCNKAKQICEKERINQLFVVNLSDLIAGRIHAQIRYQSRVDTVTQVMSIAEILAEFLVDLSEVAQIEYYDCIDNHSRLEPDKKESLDLESLVRIITWYLKERLKNHKINIHDNVFGNDIIAFKVFEHNICGVHGDKDRPDNVIKNLSLLTKQSYDLILTAHRHHFSADELNECLVVSNGSIMGTDAFAQKLRLSAKPSQNLIVCTKDNVLDCLYRICI